MKYKEDEQNFQTGAMMESPQEPICKNRNQIIIVTDNRVPEWMGNNQTDAPKIQTLMKTLPIMNLQVQNTTSTNTNKLAMRAQTVEFASTYKTAPTVSGAINFMTAGTFMIVMISAVIFFA